MMFSYQVCRECPKSTPDAADPKDGLCRAHQQIHALTAQLAEVRQQRDGYALLVTEYREALAWYADAGNYRLIEMREASGRYLSAADRDQGERARSSLRSDDDRARQIGAAVEALLAGLITRTSPIGTTAWQTRCEVCGRSWWDGQPENHTNTCALRALSEARGAGGGV